MKRKWSFEAAATTHCSGRERRFEAVGIGSEINEGSSLLERYAVYFVAEVIEENQDVCSTRGSTRSNTLNMFKAESRSYYPPSFDAANMTCVL